MLSTNWSQSCGFKIQCSKIHGRSQTSPSSFRGDTSKLIFCIQKSALGTYFYLLYICKVLEWLFPTHYLWSISQLTINNESCSIYCPLIFHSFITVRSAVSGGVGNHHVWHQEAAAQLALEITDGTTVSGNPFWPAADTSAVTVSPKATAETKKLSLGNVWREQLTVQSATQTAGWAGIEGRNKIDCWNT